MSDQKALRAALALIIENKWGMYTSAVDNGERVLSVLAALRSAPVEPAIKGARCYGCGLPYDDDGFCDVVVPNDVWAKISPTGDEGGLLCPTCIVRAAQRAGVKCKAMWCSGPFEDCEPVAERPEDGDDLVPSRPATLTVDRAGNTVRAGTPVETDRRLDATTQDALSKVRRSWEYAHREGHATAGGRARCDALHVEALDAVRSLSAQLKEARAARDCDFKEYAKLQAERARVQAERDELAKKLEEACNILQAMCRCNEMPEGPWKCEPCTRLARLGEPVKREDAE